MLRKIHGLLNNGRHTDRNKKNITNTKRHPQDTYLDERVRVEVDEASHERLQRLRFDALVQTHGPLPSHQGHQRRQRAAPKNRKPSASLQSRRRPAYNVSIYLPKGGGGKGGVDTSQGRTKHAIPSRCAVRSAPHLFARVCPFLFYPSAPCRRFFLESSPNLDINVRTRAAQHAHPVEWCRLMTNYT